jgi:asparagine synthase (glutamine-hydrolysing)
MLRTTPESFEEHQPCDDEDGRLVLVMDGRVDNWEELRRNLLARKVSLRNRSDAELVLRAYQIWGEGCVKQIDGDFAFVVWDADKQRVYCARDRVGARPFYYHWNKRTLVFASELHAVLNVPWVNQVLNKGVLAEFLGAEWYSRDETLWQGVSRLVSGHILTVADKQLHTNRYWYPEHSKTILYKDDRQYQEHYKELLFDSVRRLSRTHKPIAFEVSGGLDSSAVFAVGEKLRLSGDLLGPETAAYTLAFEKDPHANELEFARAVGRFLGREIHEIPPTEATLDWFQDTSSHYQDFPGFPNGAMNLGILYKAAERGGRVIMDGLGGDEWSGAVGNRRYFMEELASGRLSNFWHCLREDRREVGALKTLEWILRYGTFPLLPSSTQDFLRNLYRKWFLRRNPVSIRKGAWLSEELRTLLNARRKANAAKDAKVSWKNYSRIDQVALLRNARLALAYELTERSSSRVGLERRHPLMTRPMVEFSFALPERLRHCGNTNKVTHLNALQGILPDSVLNRRTKAEFSIVFRRHLERLEGTLVSELQRKRGSWFHETLLLALMEQYHWYRSNTESSCGGTAQWVFWNALVCDMLMRAE